MLRFSLFFAYAIDAYAAAMPPSLFRFAITLLIYATPLFIFFTLRLPPPLFRATLLLFRRCRHDVFMPFSFHSAMPLLLAALCFSIFSLRYIACRFSLI